MSCDNDLKNAVSSGIRHIGIGVYSSGKVREWLIRKGFDPDVASAAVKEIRERGYIDDKRAGRKIISSRTGKKQESRRMLFQRLVGGGVDPNTADDLLSETEDDETTCLMLVRSLMPEVPEDADYGELCDSLMKTVTRRGYGPDIALSAIRKHLYDTI